PSFDVRFLNVPYKNLLQLHKPKNPLIHTLQLPRFLYPQFNNHPFNTLSKNFHIQLTQHHPPIYHTHPTAYFLLKMLKHPPQKPIHYHHHF
ncbi:hypothetical protein, partial [Bacillus subtilis]|uniref:hypothetical protein n=1 Tax=Bacillus subtilis TaxID=1423 RepID=UPI002078EABA